jgi:hypothetical protein
MGSPESRHLPASHDGFSENRLSEVRNFASCGGKATLYPTVQRTTPCRVGGGDIGAASWPAQVDVALIADWLLTMIGC